MYYEKLEPILGDLESKDTEVAGGSVVGMTISITNSLIAYIANLTICNKRYEDVQKENKDILMRANRLKEKALNVIDEDPKVLDEILKAYKARKNEPNVYQKVCKNATDFCMDVAQTAFETYNLANEISKVGNKMLSSDFKICKHLAEASVKSAIENIQINLKQVEDEIYRNKIEVEFENILNKIQ